jgi:guanyl-specific ribonuclease Sa
MAKWTRLAALLLLLLVAAQLWSGRSPGDGSGRSGPSEAPPAAAVESTRHPSFLPPEAVITLELVERGGPFPYDRDGTVFQNRERRLPDQPRGYYREYTVETPGSPDRGPRRIVTGGNPPQVYYYTDDHYRSFRRVEIDQ